MFLQELNYLIPKEEITLSGESISNVFLRYCKLNEQIINSVHLSLAAGLEYLDFGIKNHYDDQPATTSKVLSGDKFYAVGLKKIAELGLDFVLSVTRTLMKITQAYANDLKEPEDFIDSFGLWENIPNFKNLLCLTRVSETEASLFSMHAALSGGDIFRNEISETIARYSSRRDFPYILKALEPNA